MSTQATSLQPYNTFGLDVQASAITPVHSVDDLRSALDTHGSGALILGGGSNILLTRDLDRPVILNRIGGIEVISEDDESVLVNAGAGVVWHELVMWAGTNNYGGIENMALIPGSTGAAPMQNIGAYGVELKDTFVALEALEIKTGSIRMFDNASCQFGYRSSIFKTSAKGLYVITSVTLRLTKNNHKLNTSYGAIEAELASMGVEPTIQSIAKAVISIRQSKLPDPAEIGNSGSFFKNPVIPIEHYNQLKTQHPGLPGYDAGTGQKKVAAGWLIEQAGWKGKTFENYGVHKKQALVLVNYGGASGQAIYELSEAILQDVQSKFNITLEREVNIL